MNITKEEFKEYEQVRSSGVTNMWNVKLVCEISGLSQDVIMEIMKNYESLSDMYPDVVK